MSTATEWLLLRQLQISKQWDENKPHISFVRTANVWMCRNVNGWPRILRYGENPGSAYRAWATAFIQMVYSTPRTR